MRYRSIALGGGGMKGGAHIGALRAIQEVQGSLEFPDGIYGSSVGSIVGGLIAFNVSAERIQTAVEKHYSLSRWLPTPSVKHAFSASSRKGFFAMDKLRQMIVDIYTDAGIENVETKTVGDSAQPFFVVASNMTTRRPTLLMGAVPLLQAILCSCCIPGLFEPQILYGNVYLDAAVYVRSIESIAPRDALILQLVSQGDTITQKSSFSEILYACYIGNSVRKPSKHVCFFKGLKVGIIDKLGDKERAELLEQGYSQTLAFLTKMRAKER